MFVIPTLLVAGGLAYSGSIVYKHLRFRRKAWLQRPEYHIQKITPNNAVALKKEKSLAQANRAVMASSLSLLLTIGGFVLTPIFMWASVPVALAVFAPTVRDAWRTIQRERRITTPVLDTTRLALCIIMGYYFALALDTWLRALTQRLFLRTEIELSDLLDQHFVDTPASVWAFRSGAEVQTALNELAVGDIISIYEGELIPADGIILYGTASIDEQLITGGTQVASKSTGDKVFASTVVTSGLLYIQVTTLIDQAGTDGVRQRIEAMINAGSYITDAGKRSGRTMAPAMGITFALLLPFWDANRAAGFLTTSFGSQMTNLGPYTLRNFATLALQQRILIYDGRALESLNLVNTIVIEAGILADKEMRENAFEAVAALRRRRWPLQEVTPHRFAVYLLSERDELATKTLAAQIGADDYFVMASPSERAELLERLQIGGRLLCYVGSGREDADVMAKALATVIIPAAGEFATREQFTSQEVMSLLKTTQAQVVLLEKDLKHLDQLFALVTQFGLNQGANIAWPLVMDLVDITTTVFIHFGLTYSVLFSYSGLLVSALLTRLPLVRYRQQHQQPQENPTEPLPPSRQLTSKMRPSHE